MIVDPGAVFTGNVIGEAGTNTLELAAGSGTIGGISSTGAIPGFRDAGGRFRCSLDAHRHECGGHGCQCRDIGGSQFARYQHRTSTRAGPGLFLLNSAATLEVAAALGSNTQMSFASGSSLVIDDFGSFGTGIGTAAYAGSLLENFGALDSIDLKGFGLTGLTSAFDNTSGLLQLANGASQKATLDFNVASLGSGIFHEVTDGSAGTLDHP